MIKIDYNDLFKHIDTAVEVFSFISEIPSPASIYIFKRIVENSCKIAELVPFEQTKEELLKVFSKYYEKSYMYFHSVLNFISNDESEDKKDENVFLRDVSDEFSCYEKMRRTCKWEKIPSTMKFVDLYPFFDFKNDSDRIKETLQSHLLSAPLDLHDVKDSDILSHCFQYLEYKNLFWRFCFDDLQKIPVHEYELFYNWYCKGEILDIIIDEILNGKVYAISNALSAYMVEKCNNSPILALIVSERFLKFRNPLSDIKIIEDEKENVSEKKSNIYVKALPKMAGAKYMSEEDYNKLVYGVWKLLCDEECLKWNECTIEMFKSIFSSKQTQHIIWHKEQYKLAAMLYVTNGNSFNKNNAAIASEIFHRYNSKNELVKCSVNTLNLPRLDDAFTKKIIKGYTQIINKINGYENK